MIKAERIVTWLAVGALTTFIILNMISLVHAREWPSYNHCVYYQSTDETNCFWMTEKPKQGWLFH